MHVISWKSLRIFWESHPDSELPLRRWYKIVATSEYGSSADLRRASPSADMGENLVVFNIGGNKFRLVASIHFNRGKVYIRRVMTHTEYNRGDWKK